MSCTNMFGNDNAKSSKNKRIDEEEEEDDLGRRDEGFAAPSSWGKVSPKTRPLGRMMAMPKSRRKGGNPAVGTVGMMDVKSLGDGGWEQENAMMDFEEADFLVGLEEVEMEL